MSASGCAKTRFALRLFGDANSRSTRGGHGPGQEAPKELHGARVGAQAATELMIRSPLRESAQAADSVEVD
jgi:hypothetical protein